MISPRPLLRRHGLDDQIAAASRRQRRLSLRNSRLQEGYHLGLGEGRYLRQPDEAILASAAHKDLVRIWQGRPIVERETDSFGIRSQREHAIGRTFSCAKSDDEEVVIVIHQLVSSGIAFTKGLTHVSNKLAHLRIELGNETRKLLCGRNGRPGFCGFFQERSR
jgi:hypothetical protein